MRGMEEISNAVKPELYIIMPAYNEEEFIQLATKEWHEVVKKIGRGSKLIVLNDGSKDSTAQKIELLKDECKDLVLINKANSGHGPTCLAGYRYALENKAKWIFQTDSDGQTRAEDFWPLWYKRDDLNFIFGYRRHRGDGGERLLISRVLRIVILLVFHIFVKDANIPFRLMRSSTLKKYIDKIPPAFFLANALLAILLVKNKENIKWIEVGFKKRGGGTPSVSFLRFFKVGLRVIKDFQKFKRCYSYLLYE